MNSLLPQDRRKALELLAEVCRRKSGAYAEAGCYEGGIVEWMAGNFTDRLVFAFDTFEGLPKEMESAGEPHRSGEFSENANQAYMDLGRIPNVRTVKGVFPSSAELYLDQRFAFVHIDFDFYLSTISAIQWFLPRMVDGGIMVFDDFGWKNCPGVYRAIYESFEPNQVQVSAQHQAFVIV